jgi:hypothetical protein
MLTKSQPSITILRILRANYEWEEKHNAIQAHLTTVKDVYFSFHKDCWIHCTLLYVVQPPCTRRKGIGSAKRATAAAHWPAIAAYQMITRYNLKAIKDLIANRALCVRQLRYSNSRGPGHDVVDMTVAEDARDGVELTNSSVHPTKVDKPLDGRQIAATAHPHVLDRTTMADGGEVIRMNNLHAKRAKVTALGFQDTSFWNADDGPLRIVHVRLPQSARDVSIAQCGNQALFHRRH